MGFKEHYLSESNKITIYHGDDYGTKKLQSKYMNMESSNSQEGIGIYFSIDKSVAESYGKDIIKTEISPNQFVNSRDLIEDTILRDDIHKLWIMLWKNDKENEDFYYFVSDFMEVYEPEDIEEWHVRELSDYNLTQEVRNLQVDMANLFGVDAFVNAWKAVFPKIIGTYNEQLQFWAILDEKQKVYPI